LAGWDVPELSDAAYRQYAQEFVAAVLERLCVPFLLLDAGGQITFANALCEDILGARDHLARDANGRAVPIAPEASRAFRSFLDALDTEGDDIDVVLTSRSGEPPLFASLSRFASPVLLGFAPLPPMAVVFIREGDEAEGVGLARTMFGLSEAEAMVVKAIIEGESVGSYAQKRGLSIHTARKQLNNAMQKLGVSRQTQLPSLIAQLNGRGRILASVAISAGK
jgi:DNA-binding CsgD family transcriptional regulator